ncbi:MAG TPA: hypothetical protein VM869_28335 [Enhygromyxa sp.]|nr:hypothetical protein [Enhygromyxa sp.]
MRWPVSKVVLLPFVVALLACNDGSGGTSGQTAGCTPGELYCECNSNLCLNGLECVAGYCVDSCIPGELGCECNSGQCLSGLECAGSFCTDPTCTPGELYCECNNGQCLGELMCSGGYCMGMGPDLGESNVEACNDFVDGLEALPCWDPSHDPMFDCEANYGDLTTCDLGPYFECVLSAYSCVDGTLHGDVDVANACSSLAECE